MLRGLAWTTAKEYSGPFQWFDRLTISGAYG